MRNLKIISAGAGSGKTYRLTQEMVNLLKSGIRADGIIATTFTTKAAAELQERVRVKLLEEGMSDKANDLTNALIGTVHGLGVKLLKRFAFEAGVSPQVDIIADEDQQIIFNKSLATVLTNKRIHVMEKLADRLGLSKKEYYDWRKEVKYLTDAARANDFSIDVLEKSKTLSFDSFKVFLRPISSKSAEELNQQLMQLLGDTLNKLNTNEDSTKKTQKTANTLRNFLNSIKLRDELHWHEWVKISKTSVGVKSKDDVEELIEFAKLHDTHPDYQKDIKDFIFNIFDIAIESLKEYDTYKKQRGLIDYIDMEIQVKRLLENDEVVNVLKEELDLLMVDEFQDTSPIQLEIFLKLSNIANHSIWVGDPKQSIYGFRGADPALMQAIIKQTGDVKTENIQKHSWRSREDIVYATNALFVKAFPNISEERVALIPKRQKIASTESSNDKNEPLEIEDAIIHWHFEFEGKGRLPGKPWMENCIATATAQLLAKEKMIVPKGETTIRPIQAGDIAILCRSNAECVAMAESLHRVGLKAAIARNGLLNTAESKLILACLKLILNKSDSLSIAEVLLLAANKNIEEIIDDRLVFLEKIKEDNHYTAWAQDNEVIKKLYELRTQVVELSGTEILNLVIEELDLRRIIASWGKIEQRMDNVDVIRKLALQYEETCNRMHTAASLSGFLLWLNEKENKGDDMQGSGDGADAVNVLTYHRSKGLEWPVVICHSMEGRLRDKIWGLNLVSEKEEVDLNNILGNRWLRYWINPYGDQFRNTYLEEQINISPIKKKATEQALQEEARLLYVGITRARDYLIFPTRQSTTRWLNRVWHNGNEEHPVLDHNSEELPWEWNNKTLFKNSEISIFPKDFVQADYKEDLISFLEKPESDQVNHLPYLIDLKNEHPESGIKGFAKTPISYTSPIKIKEETDSYQLAKLIHYFLISDHLKYSLQERNSMAEDFIERFELEDDIHAKDLIQLSGDFYQYLKNTFSIEKVYRNYPIQLFIQKRLFKATIDLILKTTEGYIIIQNNNFKGAEKDCKQKALEMTMQLHYCKKALVHCYENQNIQLFVHFTIHGNLVPIELKEN